MKEIAIDGKRDVCDSIMSVARNGKSLFLSINLNVLDPAFAPDVISQKPGGLTTRQLIYFIQRIRLLKNFKTADITGIKKEAEEKTIKTAEKLIVELA